MIGGTVVVGHPKGMMEIFERPITQRATESVGRGSMTDAA